MRQRIFLVDNISGLSGSRWPAMIYAMTSSAMTVFVWPILVTSIPDVVTTDKVTADTDIADAVGTDISHH